MPALVFSAFLPGRGAMPVFICALPNSKRAGRIPSLISDDPVAIEEFARKWDKPGYGVFRCVSKLKPGACRRSLETIGEIDGLYVDIDAKDVVEGIADVSKRLADLSLPPSELRNSGHGLHVIWRFKEAVSADDAGATVQASELLKRLTAYLCGDMAVAHPAALLREPGTHNSKNDEWLEVICSMRTNRRYDLFEIADWLDDVEGRTLFTQREAGNGHDKSAVRDVFEHKPRIDVEARLAAMKFEGAGERSIHQTQLSVTASLLRDGVALEETTRTVLTATRAAVADDPRAADWNWRREELTILRMGVDFVAKHPELVVLLPDKWRQPFEAALAAGRRVDVGLNPGGFYVRGWKTAGAGNAEPNSDSKVDDSAKERRGTHIILKPFVPIDARTLPARQWLYGRHYQRRVISATVAPGGTGKTSLVMVEAVAMATCRNLLGEQPEERCRVWLHNGEDSRDELNRRVVAICQHYKIPQEELQGWLFLTSGTEMGLKVANGYSDLKVDTALVKDMTQVVASNSIDVVMLDPLVTLHSVNESDNGKMDAVIRIFTKLADACDCSVDISHHTRKLAAGSFDHTVDDTRGASSVRDAVRALRILNVMSQNDGENLGLDEFERLSYFRVDRGKANAVAPASVATWRKFESVELANGDDVGVVTPWNMPTKSSPEEQSRDERLFLQLLDQFTRAEREVNNIKHRNYAPKVFAKEAMAKAAKISVRRLEEAMHRLFTSGQIRSERTGRPDRHTSRIVLDRK
jgi:RecA-family ATPase